MSTSGKEDSRFAHTHILGGSGHGKTQLLQTLIHRDLMAGGGTPPSVVVIDSQGDLINTLSHLALFDPDVPGSLANRLLLIDPADIAYPPAINLFAGSPERTATYDLVDQERIMNGTIELYEYFFGALLGAGLSQKQDLIFRYLAQLMLRIPRANIHTLRELLEEPKAFKADIARLDGTARLFFERQFFDKSYDDTRKQVARRLWGILANRSFERIFSSRTSKIDLFEAMNAGKVILINTSKDLLKQEGTAIFGRFFIAMIAQASLERAQLPRESRRPTFVYVDEAQDYFDDTIEDMLEQVRKYRIALILAHQTLAQLTPTLKASLMANTGTKMVGGLSASDAAVMAKEMGCEPSFLQSMRKTRTTTSFAVWIKHHMPRPREINVTLGTLEALPRMSSGSYQSLIEQNRERYCLPASVIDVPEPEPAPVQEEPAPKPPPQQSAQPTPEAPKAAAPPPPPPPAPKVEPVVSEPTKAEPRPAPPVAAAVPDPPDLDTDLYERGQGGKRHTQIQNLIRKAGQSKGYLSTIEAPAPKAGGRIDVLLSRDDFRIACEVSVTTKPEHELGNITKCLAEGVDRVALVSTSMQQLELVRALTLSLTPEEQQKLLFVSPQGLLDFLDARDADKASVNTTTRGYKVSVKRYATSQPEKEQHRERIAGSIARALARKTVSDAN